jgi:hypothetical protein
VYEVYESTEAQPKRRQKPGSASVASGKFMAVVLTLLRHSEQNHLHSSFIWEEEICLLHLLN